MRINKIYLKGYKRFRFNNIKEFTAEFPSPVTVIVGSNGSGKAQPVTDPIKVPGGWKMMGDIKVGDFVTAVDGRPARVSGVFPQGMKSLLRVKFNDGRFLDVPKEHLWTVYDDLHPEGIITTTEKLFIAVNRGQLFYIDTATPEEVKPLPMSIHPYLLGVLVAKCNLSAYPYVVTVQKEIAEYILTILPHGTTAKLTHYSDSKIGIEFVSNRDIPTNLDTTLRKMGLSGCRGYDRSLPLTFINNASEEQKYQFLQGVNDVAGYVNRLDKIADKGSIAHFNYITVSPRLADNIQQIVYSLGGVCAITVKHPFRLVDSKYLPGITTYVVSYRLGDPGRAVNEKIKRANLATHYTGPLACRLRITSVTCLPIKAKCQCIMIDHPRHLYVTKDYIVTHNTSLLNELCPLPAVRTDFEKDGMKVLEITHEGKDFTLISDFSNKNSPHSFIVNDRELNIGHTTDIQTELVEKYFGITSGIRDLIYNKIKLTKTTKSERRNLFLRINPMDLSLILDIHKKTQSKIKDCKANLTLLQTRKVDLESKMISAELLQQHKLTKKNLEEQLKLLQKITYALWQHCETILSKFQEDVEYAKTHKNFSGDEILHNCKRIYRDLVKFSKVARGDDFYDEKEKLHGKHQVLQNKKRTLSELIQNLSNEVDEFTAHLEKAQDRPVSAIEKEIADLDEAIAKFPIIEEAVIPSEFIDQHKSMLPEIKKIIEVFINADVKMELPEKITGKIFKYQELKQQLSVHRNRETNILEALKELAEETKELKENAGVPEGCTFVCGLKSMFFERNNRILKQMETLRNDLSEVRKHIKECGEEYARLEVRLKPFEEYELVAQFNRLKNFLCSGYFILFKSDEDLVYRLNTQPWKILSDLDTHITHSVMRAELVQLQDRRKVLNTELATLMKTSDASLEFLKKELAKKELEVKKRLQELETIETEANTVDSEYNLYLEYTLCCDKMAHYKEIYTREERALLVKNAYRYWKTLENEYEEIQRKIQEELRTLETLVKEQEMIRNTYETEILKNIESITAKKNVLDRIETALSPNTGIPHRSMVKYLNTMINNVNYFINGIWSYKMSLSSISDDDILDYGFPITIGSELNKDISCTSDGQAEIIDLVWVLTILLQMKLLNKIPFFADEVSRCMDEYHRGRTLTFLNSMIDTELVEQLFIINHFAAISDGFKNSNVICLNSDNLTDLPSHTNEHVTIVTC